MRRLVVKPLTSANCCRIFPQGYLTLHCHIFRQYASAIDKIPVRQPVGSMYLEPAISRQFVPPVLVTARDIREYIEKCKLTPMGFNKTTIAHIMTALES